MAKSSFSLKGVFGKIYIGEKLKSLDQKWCWCVYMNSLDQSGIGVYMHSLDQSGIGVYMNSCDQSVIGERT